MPLGPSVARLSSPPFPQFPCLMDRSKWLPTNSSARGFRYSLAWKAIAYTVPSY